MFKKEKGGVRRGKEVVAVVWENPRKLKKFSRDIDITTLI